MNCKLIVLALVLALAGICGAAQRTIKYRVFSLNGLQQPGQLTEVWPGTFYSVASSEAAFSFTSEGRVTVLATFSSAEFIAGPFVPGADGLFYNAIGQNPPSNVISLGKGPGTLRTYPGQSVSPTLVQSLADGAFFGTAADQTGAQYLIRADMKGSVTQLCAFPPGQQIWASTYASDGNYYAEVRNYPQVPDTEVIRVTPPGTVSTLAPLPRAGTALLQGSDGNLYGLTYGPGNNGVGIIFKLTLAGQYSVAYTFEKGASNTPYALIQGGDGNFYGLSGGPGGVNRVFQVTPSGQYTLLHNISAESCPCTLMQASDGFLWGTSIAGGGGSAGSIFELDGGFQKPPPQALSFTPATGRAGKEVRIWGFNLFHATVQFNGVAATGIRNAGSNYLFATVPAGAASGPITVTTPAGTSTTATNFTVR